MSTILWTRALIPPPAEVAADVSWADYGERLRVARTLRIPVDDTALVELPDPRAYRSLSRAGLLLAAVGLPAAEALRPFVSADPYGVGVYCAIEWGPNDYNSARRMVDTPPEEFAATYKALRSAKQYFKMLPNVPPAQLAIFLGVMGPLNVFNHSRLAGLHALDQAEHDLESARVDAALVCAAFSLEDPLIALRTRRSIGPDALLCEGAACVVLVRDEHYADWRARCGATATRHYGIAHDIVNLAGGRESHDGRSGAVPSRGDRDQGGDEHRPVPARARDVAQPGPGSGVH